MKQVAFVLVGIFVGFILAGAIFIVTRLPAGQPVALEPSPSQVPIEVSIIGGVVHPGVYTLPEGSRVKDAVDAAGGFLATTNAGSINLAAKLEDGQQVQIPGGVAGSSTSQPGGLPFSIIPTYGPPGTPTVSVTRININTATLAQLDSLPGIGPTTAQNIISYRTQHGAFARIQDIMNVPGIGPATFDAISNLITVGP